MSRYRGRHRKPTHTGRNLAAVSTTGAFLAAGLTSTAQDAAAATAWDVIAECESGNRNVENSSSSASGYFQIIDGTWRANGGLQFAARAIGASKAEQLIVAQRIAARRGSLADWDASRSCWGDQISSAVPARAAAEPAPQPNRTQAAQAPQRTQPRATPDTVAEPAQQPKATPKRASAVKPSKPSSSGKPGKPAAGERAAAPAGGNAVTSAAKNLLGVPYVWGGTTASGVDCSGLVYNALRKAGHNPPRTAAALQDWATPISQGNARAGDLFFWSGGGGQATHTGIYLGAGKVIEASQPGTVVTVRGVYSGITFGRIPS